MSFNGKNIIVTGSTGGMGQIICKRLASDGACLALCSNDAPALEKQIDELKQLGCDVYGKMIDITNENEVAKFFEEIKAHFGKFDGVLNLAGVSIPGKIPETPEEAYNIIMDVNVKSAFFVAKYFADAAKESAIIVNIGSAAAKNANGNAPIYCTAKAAVNMLSKAMLLQLGKQGIRITTINPGGADTPFWGTRPVDRTKLMSAEDVADVILFALGSSPRIQIHDIFFESMERFK